MSGSGQPPTAGINRSNTAVRAVLEQPCSTGGRTGTVRPKQEPTGRTDLSDRSRLVLCDRSQELIGQACPTRRQVLRLDSACPTTGRTRLFEHRSNSRVRPVNAGSALISNHLEYFPEMTSRQVHKFLQSQKWLKYLLPAHQPQMCEVNKKHFFIFEPVQLLSKAVVIPIFLFMYNSQLTSRVLEINCSNMFEDGDGVKIIIPKHIDFDNLMLTSIDVACFHRDYSEILLANGRRLYNACNHRLTETNGCADDNQVRCVPNPWRLKANGKGI
ncbi:hypothetical protein PCANC_13229 [Puccinia coronata f. sp. avenae]|uniref:Uncharacterized protein n=1 Tax=Puccinia coronata f. sp. avenae TaxID=200324 RepID=A0A2N5V052_9BASI|nr:hypothetical protein PCANC_13229 [Puccinia coronata f. sp. avenae]PLW45609.1 hypothetical protein PCASD_06226 [Puccinia coronata f. sp. avenae]